MPKLLNAPVLVATDRILCNLKVVENMERVSLFPVSEKSGNLRIKVQMWEKPGNSIGPRLKVASLL